jgi:hypothetical protein
VLSQDCADSGPTNKQARWDNFLFLWPLLLAFSIHAFASAQNEISHLLGFVASTDCKYERNGTMHNGIEAVNHINIKYEYYLDEIKSAEDFIKYSATKSLMSGKYYKIYCEGLPVMRSENWLLDELMRYRGAQK